MNMLIPQGIELCSSAMSDTQHRQAEALFNSDPIAFREYVESLGPNLCAYLIDHSGCIRYLSSSAANVLDVDAEEVMGMPWEEMVAWRSEAVLAGLDAERRIVETKTALRLVHRFFAHDGEQRAVRVWAAPVLDETGAVTAIAGYLERADYRLAVRLTTDELN